MDNIIGIFHADWRADDHSEKKKTPFWLYNRALYIKANPRDENYMKELFSGYYPAGTFINAGKDPDWVNAIPTAGEIVLLYPDAIGLGFRPIETRVIKLKKRISDIYILNGRRRKFLFSSSKKGLYLRRLGERSMCLELLVIILFIVVTPVMLVIDWADGHK